MVNEEHLFGFGLFALFGVSLLRVFVCVWFLVWFFFLNSRMLYVEHLPLAVPLNVTSLHRASLGHLQPPNIVSNLQPLTAGGC